MNLHKVGIQVFCVLAAIHVVSGVLATASAGYILSSDESTVRILTDKAGILGALGHRHVIRVEDLRGQLESGTYARGSGEFSLWFEVASLVLDQAQDRQMAGEGYGRMPSPKAIKKTRVNMLGTKVLAAGEFPTIRLAGTARRSGEGGWTLETAISIRGVTHEILIYPQVSLQTGRLVVSGSFVIKQSDFAIEPYSAGLRSISVADRLEIRYTLVFLVQR